MNKKAIGLIATSLVLLVYSLFIGRSTNSEVSVYNWSNYISQELLEDFEKETGIKVIYNVFDSNEALETNLLVGGGGGYDVVVPSATYLRRQIGAGVYQKLDKSKLPNLVNLLPHLREKFSRLRGVNDYSVNYAWGTTGFGINKRKILALLPGAPLHSMRLLFDEEIIASLADCGVYVLNDSDEMIPAALRYLGLDTNSVNKEEIKRAGKILKRIQPYVKKFHSSSYVEALANGEACLVFGWSGDILQAKKAAEAANNGVEIDYVIAKEGGQIWFDQLAIPASAPNRENAHVFINYLLDKEVNKKLSAAIRYPTATVASSEDGEESDFYPSAAVLPRLYIMPVYLGEIRKFVSQIWLEVKLGL